MLNTVIQAHENELSLVFVSTRPPVPRGFLIVSLPNFENMRMLFLAVILLTNSNLWAQKDVPPPPPPKDSQNSKDTIGVFDKVDIEARFPGGDSAWRKYLENNFRVEPVSDAVWKELPAKVKRKSGSVNLTAIVQFIVCKDGSLCEIKTINKIPTALKAEAERLIADSKLWEPAMQNGRQVKAYRRQPITLVISID